MKQFNLEEYLDNPNRKVVTRDGRPVKIHCTNFGSGQHIVAEIEVTNRSDSFTKDGSFYYGDHPSICDLFFAPEKKASYVNVYKNAYGAYVLGEIFIGKECEEVTTGLTYIATAKIEWEE